MTWRNEAIEQIDAILHWVAKRSKWDVLAQRLRRLLASAWGSAQKQAIEEAISALTSGDPSRETVKEMMAVLDERLGGRLAESLRDAVSDVQGKSYQLAHKDIGVVFEFNRPDRRALSWLERDMMYWIGTYYERELRQKIDDAARDVVREGMGRIEAAAHMKKVFEERFSKTDQYWEGLSNHVVTRAREFGRVSAYDKAGVKYFKVMAHLDHRTSRMCRAMNGRIIAVDVARQQRDAIMNAKTPEDAKKVAPWLTDAEVSAKIEGKPSGNLPKGIGLPPYHFNCRTRTVMARESEIEELQTISQEPNVNKP